MMTLTAVQTLHFDTQSEYQSHKTKIERLAQQTGASVEWKDEENTAVLTAEQTLLSL